jgi:hypothetical protein
MPKIDPQQELFTALRLGLERSGNGVYDGILPPEDTPYPFYYLGDSLQTDSENKSAVFGNVQQVIHIWHNDTKQRGTVSAMLLYAKTICREISKTANFSWNVRNITQRIIPDNTTKNPLIHGVLEVEFYFS